jgi:hypothetical protein
VSPVEAVTRVSRTIVCVLQDALQIVLYAVLAGASPIAFAATITVMQAGRVKALGFGVGFVAAQLATCLLFLQLDVAVSGSQRKHYPGVQVALEVILAVVLVWLARRRSRRALIEGEIGSHQTHRMLERLGRLRLLTAITAGVVLGIGVPKRLILALLTATTIDAAGVRPSVQALLVVAYVAIATALVWVPVVLFTLFGDRVIALMRQTQDEIVRRQPQVTIRSLQLLAALFALDAFGVLVTQLL